MDPRWYQDLALKALTEETISVDQGLCILSSKDIEILPLIASAYQVRYHFWQKDVTIHILNNVQNGLCPEDCHYCAQSKDSHANIQTYPMKSDDEILDEAHRAYTSGAFRYCMVFSGKSQDDQRIDHLVQLIKEIKSRFPLEVCVSPGFISEEQAKKLKQAGLNRINHNLNTSESFYHEICTTHRFTDRLQTLNAAQKADLDICSGIIIGMGESDRDIVSAAIKLHELKKVRSIPINFFLPIKGVQLSDQQKLTPEFCLRVLCLFRFFNPSAEIRMAAGREYHLRDLQVLGLYPANSLFLDGYLNAQGSSRLKTLRMIKDAGFSIKSDQNLDDLIDKEKKQEHNVFNDQDHNVPIKNFHDLHPFSRKD